MYTIQIIKDEDKSIVKSINISESDVKFLKDSLNGESGILTWIVEAIKGKIENCKKRLRNQWSMKLVNEEILPPKDDSEFISLIKSRDDYKDRAKRDQEELTRLN